MSKQHLICVCFVCIIFKLWTHNIYSFFIYTILIQLYYILFTSHCFIIQQLQSYKMLLDSVKAKYNKVCEWLGHKQFKANDEMNHQIVFKNHSWFVRNLNFALQMIHLWRSLISTRNKRKRSIHRIAVHNKQNNKIIGFS